MKKLLFVLGLLLVFSTASFAGIPVPSTEYTGSRTTPASDGIDSTGGYTEANGGVKIAWKISFDGTYWNYTYIITDKDGSLIAPDLSHWILEVSPDIPLDKIGNYIFDANATVVTPPDPPGYWPEDPEFPNTTQAGVNNGNPNLGTNLIGVKFDTSSDSLPDGKTYTFKSIEPPIWGDFYLK